MENSSDFPESWRSLHSPDPLIPVGSSSSLADPLPKLTGCSGGKPRPGGWKGGGRGAKKCKEERFLGVCSGMREEIMSSVAELIGQRNVQIGLERGERT